jgi:hypothetical protein
MPQYSAVILEVIKNFEQMMSIRLSCDLPILSFSLTRCLRNISELVFNVLTVIAATASELETPTQQPKPIGPSGKPSRKPLQS